MIAVTSADKVDNRQLKVLLTAKYGNQIRFSRPGSNKKSAMIYLDCVPSEQMADTIREHDAINDCAKILRSSLLNVDFGLQDKFCDAQDLESAWNGTKVPEDLLRFFGAFSISVIQISITLVVKHNQMTTIPRKYLCQEGVKWLHCSKHSTMLSIVDTRELQCIS